MAARVMEHATYEDLMKVPDNLVAELIDGELYTSPRPAGAYTNAALWLLDALSRASGWTIEVQRRLRFGATAVIADLAGWRVTPPADEQAVPDWVCEVVSDSTARMDRMYKRAAYHKQRVSNVWLVEPALQTVEVLQWSPKGWLWTIHGENEVARIPPFAEIEIDLALLWGAPPS